MKDYNKIFADENKPTFDHQKEIQTEVNKHEKKIGKWTMILTVPSLFLLIYFDYGWTFLGFHWEWAANVCISDGDVTVSKFMIAFIITFVLFVVAFILCAIIIGQTNKSRQKLINADRKWLKEKANEFATTVYLNDMISALSTVFTLDTEFKDNFKKIIVKFEWFQYDGFRNYGHDLTHFYKNGEKQVWIEEKLLIKHEGSKYRLQRWEYEEDAFRFFFEKINPNGLVEKDVEFRLPVID